MTDPTPLRELAEQVAVEAGRLVAGRRARGGLAVSTKSSPTDMVSEMDTAAEHLIVEALLAARPDDGILGEEGGARRSSSGITWVIDPIDGTTNYLYGIPQYAVSIAAVAHSQGADPAATNLLPTVVAGVVHDPEREQTFSAGRGQGATLDGVTLRCSTATDLTTALVATGFGYAATRRAAQAKVAAAVLPLVRDIRRFGAASLDLCAVADGRVDAYYEQGLAPWDLAGGGLIAAEAGARVSGLRGAPAGPNLVVAAAPGLVEPLHALLVELDADAPA